jgi:beta-lactamase class A
MFRPPSAFLCLLFCAFACSAPARAQPETESPLQDSNASSLFERELNALANKTTGTLGIGIRDLTTGQDFFVNADRPFSQAGLSKIYVLAALLRESSLGRINLDTEHKLSAQDKLPGGILYRLGDDSVTMSLRDYATLMVTIDDNSATQVILSRITTQAVHDTLRALGSEKIHFAGLITDPQKPEDNLASPRDLLDCLHALYEGPVLDTKTKEAFFSILSTPRQGALRTAIPRHIRVASKSGLRGSLRCTAAIVFLKKHPYTIVVLSQPASPGESVEGTDITTTVSAISKLAYEYFSKFESQEPISSEATASKR